MPKLLKSVLVASIGLAIAGAAYAQSPLNAAAAALGFDSVGGLQNAVLTFCEG